jgi:type III pantothenate kinase
MIRVLDIGNSRVHCGSADEESRIISHLSCASDRCAKTLRSVYEYCIGDTPDAVVYASVKPVVSDALERYFTLHSPELLMCGLTHRDFRKLMPFKIPEDTAVGADRCANAYALYRDKEFPVVSVDFGTAITLEVLDATGSFCGGAILPGVMLQSHSLHRGAASLPELDSSESSTRSIGRTTNAALHAGIIRGTGHAVHGLLEEMSHEAGAAFRRIVLTGGYASLYSETFLSAGVPVCIDTQLTLRGIAYGYYG